MLLALRSLLWRHSHAITGTCDTAQNKQTDDCIGSTPVTATAGGSLPARRRRSAPAPVPLPEIERIPAIVGIAATYQPGPLDAMRASLNFIGEEVSYQARQESIAFGEMIDVDLELLSAILMEVA